MRSRFLLQKLTVFFLILASVSGAFTQRSGAPKQEKLLNGLKILMWPDAASDKVTLRVRIHSGSAFDPQGKEGVMAMLSNTFFPNENSRGFFKEDLGGGLSVTTNYDYVQIEASAKADEFLTMLEAVATAVSNPTIDKETTAKLKTEHLAKLASLEKDSSYVADRAVAKRLFGTFPYGRPELGTAESVNKIDFADLIDAKQRFLAADNATVTISGKFDNALAYRAARRYFGSWLKSDKLSPSTFKQPDEPDTKMVSLSGEFSGEPQVRFALRGLSRSDKDYIAAVVLASVLSERLNQNLTSGSGFVSNQAHILPGALVLGFQGSIGESTPANLPALLLAKAITAEEFASAKSKAASTIKGISVEELWLNADTYRLASASEESKAINAVSLADVQRVAERLSKNPVVGVAAVNAEKPATTN